MFLCLTSCVFFSFEAVVMLLVVTAAGCVVERGIEKSRAGFLHVHCRCGLYGFAVSFSSLIVLGKKLIGPKKKKRDHSSL